MNPSDHPCHACLGNPERREFLRDAAGMATAALIALGLNPARAAAMALRSATGRRTGAEVGYPIPAVDGATIDKTNEVILVRHAGTVFAFALSCPHQNTALHWLDDEARFQCPKHKSRYEADGTFISGRATRNMDRLPIRSDGKEIFVNVDRVFESDKDPSGWASATAKV